MVVEGLGQSEQQHGPECMHTTNQVKRKGMGSKLCRSRAPHS